MLSGIRGNQNYNVRDFFMGRYSYIPLITILFLSTSGFSRTYPVSDYDQDKNANYDYAFGDYVSPGEKLNYSDPNFEDAIKLPSPLYNPIYQSYDALVVANKSDISIQGTDLIEKGQTVRVYLRKEALLRIGSHKFEKTQGYDETSGLIFYWYGSTARAGKTTPSGFYLPESFSSEHQSSLYNNAHMPWTVFFNANIGSHGVLGTPINMLGKEASAGCIRLEPQRARDLFHLIGQLGRGLVDAIDKKTGAPLYLEDGSIKQVEAYKTIYIVKD